MIQYFFNFWMILYNDLLLRLKQNDLLYWLLWIKMRLKQGRIQEISLPKGRRSWSANSFRSLFDSLKLFYSFFSAEKNRNGPVVVGSPNSWIRHWINNQLKDVVISCSSWSYRLNFVFIFPGLEHLNVLTSQVCISILL